MDKAIEIFEKHWKLKTGKELDEATKFHMQYCIDAIVEAQNIKQKHSNFEELLIKACKYGYEYCQTSSFPKMKFEDMVINNFKQVLVGTPEQYELKFTEAVVDEKFKVEEEKSLIYNSETNQDVCMYFGEENKNLLLSFLNK